MVALSHAASVPGATCEARDEQGQTTILNSLPARRILAERKKHSHLVAQDASGDMDVVVVVAAVVVVVAVVMPSAATRASRVEAAISWNFIVTGCRMRDFVKGLRV